MCFLHFRGLSLQLGELCKILRGWIPIQAELCQSFSMFLRMKPFILIKKISRQYFLPPGVIFMILVFVDWKKNTMTDNYYTFSKAFKCILLITKSFSCI